ncbi:LysR family transcriptional regulator [Paraburkholderia sp. BL23I1N1]|uniref:helix-turn-helix domain-containing protein n=1 Tax=Paraburkholderia sp. BL23I1N1 TaxID=1938802 RepID=UPI000E76F27B|nr:LysR family transcriptional regulator [Paraburkholderia sp. BL23I1N1]
MDARSDALISLFSPERRVGSLWLTDPQNRIEVKKMSSIIDNADTEPSHFLYFASVVRNGSFTRAAEEIGVSKSTLSRVVASMEAQSGVALLERTTRRIKATTAGLQVFECCMQVHSAVRRAQGVLDMLSIRCPDESVARVPGRR